MARRSPIGGPEVLTIVAFSTSIISAFFFIYELIFNAEVILRFRVSEMVLAAVFMTIAIIGRRHYNLASALFVITFLYLSVGLALQTGRNTGLHYFLLGIGPTMPVLYGTRRPLVIAAICGVSTFAFLVIEFTVPMYVALNRPWLPQMRIPFVEPLDLDYQDSIFVLVVAALQLILTLTSFVAFRISENAEAALEREYARSEMLLQNLLPRPIAARLKNQSKDVIADEFDLVTVLFADIVNFTPRTAARKPDDTVRFLERIFREFDLLVEKHGLKKIKTIGDAYMVAGGMPERGGDHTSKVADMALDMIEVAERLTNEFAEDVSVRIGFHAGPAIAGVIGRRKPFYDVWGDTINVAARMESSGLPGRIQITPEVKEILGQRYRFEERGVVDVKGKGPMSLYFLNGANGTLICEPRGHCEPRFRDATQWLGRRAAGIRAKADEGGARAVAARDAASPVRAAPGRRA